jgi:hypothetical protein
VPAATRSWTAERSPVGLAVAVAGAVLAVLGMFVLDWDAGANWLDVRRAVGQNSDAYSVLSQVYSRVLYLPLLVGAVAAGLCATAERTVARIGSAAAGIGLGTFLVGVFIWVETGAVGTDATRRDALLPLVLIALVGVACAVLGAGAAFDTTSTLARVLALVVAGLAVLLDVYIVADVLDTQRFGAWVAVAGYGLLVIAPVLPYRRVTHAR